MSVSDPLLKNLKNYLYSLRMAADKVDDNHEALLPFCQLLELILRKGLKPGMSMFELNRLRDYWQWIEQMSLTDYSKHQRVRKHPLFDVIFEKVSKSAKVTSAQGRGRYFLREALQAKILVNVIELLFDDTQLLLSFYDPVKSIMAHEILFEIFKSMLLQTVEIKFDLCLSNHSFLDETWKLSTYKRVDLVPCKDVGLQVLHIHGRVIVTEVVKGSVAESTNEIEVGDVLDDLFDRALRNVTRGSITSLLKRYSGQPISLALVKSRDHDGCIYQPIGELLKQAGVTLEALQRPSNDATGRAQYRKTPPHAMLPEDIDEELPVHGAASDKAFYNVQLIGKCSVGQTGGVDQIEPAIQRIISADVHNQQTPTKCTIELCETNIVIKKHGCDEVLMSVSYTEVSSCGLKDNAIEYFAFIAGDTTCTLAKSFVAHVFKAETAEESKIIICAIAQGFSRTHWFV